MGSLQISWRLVPGFSRLRDSPYQTLGVFLRIVASAPERLDMILISKMSIFRTS